MDKKSVRVRFAPSPTGPLHIGGVRTALYNYLFAKKAKGTMILRIEDTDQNRLVKGAEKYIQDALAWCGIEIDEGPGNEGNVGPYRQSERGEIYKQFTHTLIEKGWAYKAYDTAEELNAKREEAKQSGNHAWQYGISTRLEMKNTLSLSSSEIEKLEQNSAPFVVRFKVPKDETIVFHDIIRGKVEFDTNQLDDKVLFKADGFPTYHMANVIDDYLMKISHVIRGEEWLSSTPLHVLLYKAFGWADHMPEFAHLPLILKPVGQGKLSKRDGAKFGFPVFPLNWEDPKTNEQWAGYKETGFLPEGFLNLLAFLGWNPGSEQEVYSKNQLIQDFSLERVSKSGARFDYDKAKWFNQQHIIQKNNAELMQLARPYFEKNGQSISDEKLEKIIELYKERVEFLSDLPTQSYYLFDDVKHFDEKAIRKKWKPSLTERFTHLANLLHSLESWNSEHIEATIKKFLKDNELGFGQVLPALRLAICGTMKGPSIFDVMALLPQENAIHRITNGIVLFNKLKTE